MKITKVAFTYSNGKTEYLEGKEAQEWANEVNSYIAIQSLRTSGSGLKEREWKKGRKDILKDLENHIDTFVSLQENNAGLNQEDALNLQMGIGGFLLSYKLTHSKEK